MESISALYYGTGYLLDPHTAVAAGVYQKYLRETKDHTVTVIASTASPYKFPQSVLEAVDKEKYQGLSDEKLVEALHKVSGRPIPQAIEELRTAEIRHCQVVDAADMPKAVREILGL